jgi:hypothetical protein
VVVVLVVVIVFAIPIGFVGATTGQPSGVLQADDDVNQSSTPSSHQNPSETTEPEESQGVEEHLEEILSNRLEDSTEDATEADYQTARRTLGGDYNQKVGRYTEVAGESQAELYLEAREQHYQFIASNERFDELQAAYREARRDGNDRRASELRDQMQQEATTISESGNGLISSYRTLEERTGANRSEAIRLIEARQTEVDQFVTQTEGAGSVNTTLLISTDRTNISFDEPARINGKLETASGAPIANQNVSIVVEDQLYRVQTDSAGQFDLVHRPVDSLGAATLDIQYLPNETSEYRVTRREIPVNVSRVDSAIRIEPPTSAASFETNLTTAGVVVAGSQNRPVPDVPVALFVDNQRLDTADTNETGRFVFSTAIPRSTNSGEARIEVRMVDANQSIAPSSNTTRVQIEPVTTTVALQTDTNETNSRSVAVSGVLETASGKPIPNSTVDLTVNGNTVDTVSTTQNGTFERTLTLSEDAENSTATIGATFSGEGTHLRPTTETIDLQPSGNETLEGLQPSPPQNDDGELSLLPFSTRDLLFIGGGMLTLFGLVGFWWVRRDGTATPERSTVDDSVSTESTPESSHTLFSVAEQQLAANAYENAVVLAYVAVRRQLGQFLGVPDAATHRELSRSYAATERDHSEELERITQHYERVRYASEAVDEPTAARAVSAAEQILDETDQSENEPR